jgi:hypothetical protein
MMQPVLLNGDLGEVFNFPPSVEGEIKRGGVNF